MEGVMSVLFKVNQVKKQSAAEQLCSTGQAVFGYLGDEKQRNEILDSFSQSFSKGQSKGTAYLATEPNGTQAWENFFSMNYESFWRSPTESSREISQEVAAALEEVEDLKGLIFNIKAASQKEGWGILSPVQKRVCFEVSYEYRPELLVDTLDDSKPKEFLNQLGVLKGLVEENLHDYQNLEKATNKTRGNIHDWEWEKSEGLRRRSQNYIYAVEGSSYKYASDAIANADEALPVLKEQLKKNETAQAAAYQDIKSSFSTAFKALIEDASKSGVKISENLQKSAAQVEQYNSATMDQSFGEVLENLSHRLFQELAALV